MRTSTLFSSILLGASALTNHFVVASDVVDLTSDSFPTEVLKEELALVEFFAPWCGHCKNLAPHYEEAATELKTNHGIKLAKVDCTENQELCQDHGIKGYPTLKVFRSGEASDYSGPRKADGIISYMVKQSLPAISEVKASEHEQFKTKDKVVVVAYVASESDLPAAFKSTAESLRDSFLFGYSTDLSLSPTGSPTVVLYKQFDEGSAVVPGKLSSLTDVALKEFIKENSIPIMDQVSPENFASYAEQGLPIAYLFWDPSDADNLTKMTDALKATAKSFKGRVNFVWIDAVKFAEHAKSLNIPEGSFPAFVIQDIADKGRKYLLTEFGKGLTADKIQGFMRDYEDGKVEPSLKSAEIPTEQDEPVYTLVTKEFDQVVFDDKKDVFVEFYAPWCGHCQRLAPIWESLAEHFEDFQDSLVIAKMDATENDLPLSAKFDLAGFPTIKFKKAGTTDFIDYNGDRSLEDLIKFVQETANNSLEGGASDAEDGVEDEDESEAAEHDEL